jgi:hypothetical protein
MSTVINIKDVLEVSARPRCWGLATLAADPLGGTIKRTSLTRERFGSRENGVSPPNFATDGDPFEHCNPDELA